jgi:flagellar hook-associated protein 3 FlgL
MRITHGMLTDTTIRNLSANLTRLEEFSNQLTSGKRIDRPSDDPVGVASALSHRATLEQLEQHLKNIAGAKSWLEATDAALDSAGAVLLRARELAVQGANDSLSPEDRLAIRSEIDNLIENVLQVSNATYSDQYLFAGARTTTPAYAAGTPPAYQGDTTLIQREIAPGTNITVNVVGQTPFDPIFSALAALSTALGANDTSAINAAISSLASAHTTLLTTRAQVGARLNRLGAQEERLMTVQVNVTELLTKVEDTDYTATITNFSTAQTVYKAALEVGARTLQPSLLDYLR